MTSDVIAWPPRPRGVTLGRPGARGRAPSDARRGGAISRTADDAAGRGGAPGALALVGALGVVFGDIGTSPLCAATAVVATAQGAGAQIDRTFVYGMTSTVLWSLTLVVSILYAPPRTASP
ncbi:KUP/HAK/KT family potassium transporter [Oerskovia paurometabola]|uniref:KUP/HAK/KT family potassium transporter n=1 Tax=Oerskovia paurometabola TaxID=162170 RepID=A0ABW1X6N7_9CELL|nr:KUP/HAK/KT family potassium transporter [Oerskovia paurometabola]MBM7495834.1 hypothetical protein [Oerskovia paurometabola]